MARSSGRDATPRVGSPAGSAFPWTHTEHSANSVRTLPGAVAPSQQPRHIPSGYIDEDTSSEGGDQMSDVHYSIAPDHGRHPAQDDHDHSSIASTCPSTVTGRGWANESDMQSVGSSRTTILSMDQNPNGALGPGMMGNQLMVHGQAIPMFAGQEPFVDLPPGSPSNSDGVSAQWEQESMQSQLEGMSIRTGGEPRAQPQSHPQSQPQEPAMIGYWANNDQPFHMQPLSEGSHSAHTYSTISLNDALPPGMPGIPYALPCEFARIDGCPETFSPDRENDWIQHIETFHLRNRFPSKCICWFCNTQFETEKLPVQDRSRRINFEMRLYHIADHLRTGSKTMGDWMPDFDLLRHLNKYELINRDRYNQLMEYQQGTHLLRFERPDYLPPEVARRREREAMIPYDQEREDRERRRQRRGGLSSHGRSRRRERV